MNVVVLLCPKDAGNDGHLPGRVRACRVLLCVGPQARVLPNWWRVLGQCQRIGISVFVLLEHGHQIGGVFFGLVIAAPNDRRMTPPMDPVEEHGNACIHRDSRQESE